MINKKLVGTPVKMMNRMEEITDLICEYNDEVQKQQEEIERLHSIIKEVREYIEELSEDTEDYIGAIDRRRKVELLEILDKENK